MLFLIFIKHSDNTFHFALMLLQYLRIHMILQELYKANTDTNLSHLDQKAEL